MKLKPEEIRPGYFNAAGKKLPSVTTITKLLDRPEGLIRWAYNCGRDGIDMDKAKTDAGTAGHICHSMIECAIKGAAFHPGDSDPELLGMAQQGFKAFQSWLAMSRFELLHTEVRLISERYQYGGRLDCIATILDELCIVDWKTSARVYASYLAQVAAYRSAWNETHRDQEIAGCHLLRVKKENAGFVHHFFTAADMDAAWQAFVCCRELYEWQKKLDKLV